MSKLSARNDYKPPYASKGKIESQSPWEVIGIDIIGSLPATENRAKYICTIVDCFTKYCILVPLWQHTAIDVSRVLYERVISYFGVPSHILSDRGAEFTSTLWKNLLELFNISPILTSPYYPQGNAIVERHHRIVGNMIHAFLSGGEKDWGNALSTIMLMLNATAQENHVLLAAKVMWVKELKLPIDLKREVKIRQENSAQDYSSNVCRNLQEVHDVVRRLI